MRLRSGLLAIAVVAVLCPNRVEASPIIFTDRAAFNAVVQPNVFVGFDTFIGGFGEGGDFCPLESSPVCGGVADGILFVASGDQIGTPNPFGGNLTFGGEFGYADLNLVGPGLNLVGPAFFTAIGFDVLQSSATQGFYLATPDGFFQSFTRPTGFIGFLFPTPIGVVQVASFPLTLEQDSSRLVLDNFVFKSVPEPSTMLLVGSALAFVQGVRYRRRSSQ